MGGNEYIAKLTRLSTSAFQAKDYAKVIYDLHLRRKLIELSENTLTEANNKNLENTAEQLIEGTEKVIEPKGKCYRYKTAKLLYSINNTSCYAPRGL